MTGKGKKPIVRIGGAAGALIDSAIAVPQLLGVENLDYLVLDYLGEGAMGIFARMKQADPASGFLPDFIDVHMGPHLAELKARGIRVVSNAGGLNPRGLAHAIRQCAQEMDLDIKVAAVDGDDLMGEVDRLRAEGVREMFTGTPLPERITSMNAYLGAFPIAAALDAGADIVVTGRVVDSAMVLGPLIHEFGWKADDYDLLAAGTITGHLLECGVQVSGGTFTDWRQVPDWDNMGFPVGECQADGTAVITKPDGTGGLVSVGTVSEQLMYEVGDPRCYFVPDVTCDFSDARIEQVGPDRVKISGVRGYPPSSSYKACMTYDDGWRSISLQPIIGGDAPAKARMQADALLKRAARLLRESNLGEWRNTHVEIIGTEASYGPQAQPLAPREVLLKIVVDHEDERATRMFWREQGAATMNMAPGTSIAPILATPPSVPITSLCSILIDKKQVRPHVWLNGEEIPFVYSPRGGFDPAMLPPPPQPVDRGTVAMNDMVDVPLVQLAWLRSGEKGDLFNVGIIARRAEYMPFLRASLTVERMADHYRHLFNPGAAGRVDLFEAPGVHALNFVFDDAQGGGINTSPRLDPAAKSMAQRAIDLPIKVPRSIADGLGAPSA